MDSAIWVGLVTAVPIALLFVIRPRLMRYADRHRARRLEREKAEHDR